MIFWYLEIFALAIICELIDLTRFLTAQERASWPVATHMQRVQFMAEVYSANTSTWYLNPEMKANFSKSYDYWFSGAFKNTNPNWFANQISKSHRGNA